MRRPLSNTLICFAARRREHLRPGRVLRLRRQAGRLRSPSERSQWPAPDQRLEGQGPVPRPRPRSLAFNFSAIPPGIDLRLGNRSVVPNAKVDLFLRSSTNPPVIHLRMQPGLLSNSAEFRIAQYNGGNTFTDRLMVRANSDFEVTADAFKRGGGSWAMSSDARLKHHVTPLAGRLERLLSLRGVSFECLTPDPAKRPPGVQLGFVAQEVQPVFPDWVGADSEGYLTVASRGFEALTVEAQRELRGESATIDGKQDARIGALEARNAELAADNQALRAESEALQRGIEQIEAPMVACGGLAR